MSFLAMDPPRHTRMRGLVSRAFTPRRIADLEPRVRELARRHIDRFVGEGRCDFVRDFAARLPMDVISDMLGVPEGDRDMLRAWADTVVHREDGMYDIPPAAWRPRRAARVLRRRRRRARRRPCDDLSAALLTAEVDGDRLDDAEVVGFLFLMIIAGNETTAKLLGNALYWLWRNPEQRRRRRGRPALIPRWVEETLRYDGSTQALARTLTATSSCTANASAPATRVVLLVGSGNRDERVFPDADRFDVSRDTSDMLSFGHGLHFCLGAALARPRGRVALEEVQRRLPDCEIDPPGSSRIHSVNVRGFAALRASGGRAMSGRGRRDRHGGLLGHRRRRRDVPSARRGSRSASEHGAWTGSRRWRELVEGGRAAVALELDVTDRRVDRRLRDGAEGARADRRRRQQRRDRRARAAARDRGRGPRDRAPDEPPRPHTPRAAVLPAMLARRRATSSSSRP
jgi:cytochrome P450